MTEHTRWRLDLAKKMAAAYVENPKTRVVMVAGSTGRGTADAFSDIEIDVYYTEPPTEEERIAAVRRCGAELVSLGEVEWEEQMDFSGFPAATSTFLVSTMERFITRVVDQGDPDTDAQMRLYSVQHAIPVFDEDQAKAWQERADVYPDGLVTAMLDENLRFRFFRNVDMILARNDAVALYDGIVEVQKRLLRALLGLNRIYLPIPDPIKRLDEIIDEIQVKPDDLSNRLREILHVDGPRGIDELEHLIEEVFGLVAEHCSSFDIASRRGDLKKIKQPRDRPPSR